MSKKLLKNTVYLYVLTIVKIAFPLLTLPYLTRVLSVDVYGLVSYVKAYNSYIQLFLDFGFLLSATRAIAESKGNITEISRITWNTIIEKFFLGVVALFVTIVAISVIPILSANRMFVWLYFFSCIITIFIPDFLYRGIEKMEYAAIPFVCAKIVVLFLTFSIIKSDSDVLLIPILEISGNFVAAVISVLFLKKCEVIFRVDKPKQWINDIKKSSIYFFSNFATTFFGAMTTLIAGIYLNTKDIAFWSLSMQVVTVAKSMYNPITNSIYPHMVLNRDLKLVHKLSVLFSIPLALGCIVVILFGGEIMALIGGNNYYDVGIILKFLLPVFVSSFYSMLYGWPVLGAINMIKETTITTMIAAFVQIVCIVVTLIFDKFSLINLAICCCISEISLLLLRLGVFKQNIAKFK